MQEKITVSGVPETMAVRERLLPAEGAISQIAMSAMKDWGGAIREQDGPVLVIIEGLTMYLYQEDVQRIFQVIARRFSQADVLVETMNPMVVKRFREKSIDASHARFTWGVKNGAAAGFPAGGGAQPDGGHGGVRAHIQGVG